MFDTELIKHFYSKLEEKVQKARSLTKKPLTLTEKILYSHLDLDRKKTIERGKEYLLLSPDRVAMQDATAQMALLQFISSGKNKVAVPSTVHCDHLIQAEVGAKKDLARALEESNEVFSFLQSVSSKYGIGFWKPGAGIIHQVVLENYAFPGGLMIGTDSHTPNAGGLGMLAIGVGGADAVDVMAGMAWELKCPKIIGVHLKGKMEGWTSAKDVILKLAGILSVKGGTGYVIEYFGEGTSSISCTGKATICNMGAEIGATTSIFPFDSRMKDYLVATNRDLVAKLASLHRFLLMADEEILENPDSYYDKIIEIDLSSLEPHVNGPYSPDKAWRISELKEAVSEQNYPDKISVSLIGSCTNSSYEDMTRAVSIAKQAESLGIKAACPLTITPGSEQIHATMERDGLIKDLESIGGLVLANACGPCIGQWKRHDVTFGEKNSILTSYNRNFAGRNDANPGTHSFVASPEITIAMALSGSLSFNPLTDYLVTKSGERVKLLPPSGEELPKKGFVSHSEGYLPPAEEGHLIEIKINPESERLEILDPFDPWNGEDLLNLWVLMKASGKCTTDHISPAGKWLKYRGHLDKISDNLFIGAKNAFRNEIGKGINLLDDSIASFSQVARAYKKAGKGWVAIGDENYGEGSSREHAAMEPRYLGCRAVIAKSFARIHETNLKKQGILALTFVNSEDYNKIKEDDVLYIRGLKNFDPKKYLELEIIHKDRTSDKIPLNHTLNHEQFCWFKAGSALNSLKSSLHL